MASKKSGTPVKRTAKPTASKNYRSADAAAGAASVKAKAKAKATGQSKESSMDAVTRRYTMFDGGRTDKRSGVSLYDGPFDKRLFTGGPKRVPATIGDRKTQAKAGIANKVASKRSSDGRADTMYFQPGVRDKAAQEAIKYAAKFSTGTKAKAKPKDTKKPRPKK
jgi:hypothetical protein